MKKIRVLIADDHPLFLEGLHTVLSLKDPEIDIAGAVSNGKEAVEKDRELCPDVVLLDIKMPVMDGVEAARLIKKQHSDVKIIMLTTFDDRELVSAALKAGASGYILKDTPVQELIQDIKSVFQGNVLMSAQAAAKLNWTEKKEGTKKEKSGFNFLQDMDELTTREKEILMLMVRGMNNTRIAEELYISEKTVRNYVSHIYDILGVQSRTQAVLWALEHGVTK